MNFKRNRMLFALMLGIGITMIVSCTEEELRNSGGGKTGPDNTEEGYLSIQLTSAPNAISSVAPRAADYGSKEEYVVKNAYMVLYSANDMKVVHQNALAINNGDGSQVFNGSDVATTVTTNTKDLVTVKAQKVKKQEYKLLVILNAKSDMIGATQPGKQFTEFERAFQQDLSQVSEDGNYLPNGTGYRTEVTMTNADGLITIVESDFEETAAAAETKPALPRVKVDRILAKVEFLKKADTTSGMYPNGGMLGDSWWILDITNKHTFWMRRFALTAPVNGGNPSGGPGPMEDNPSVPREVRYAIDPNWDNISLLRLGNRDYDPITTQFNTFYKENITSASPALGLTATRMYALENTMAAADQWEDVTTRILIKGNFRPVVYEPNSQGSIIAPNSSYYYYQGAAFTHSQLTDMLAGSMPWPTTPTGLEEVVKNGTTQVDLYLNQSSIPATAVSKTSVDGKLTLYVDGISYYAIKIRHFDDAQSEGSMNYGRYGLVRNNIYRVTLSKVAGPGKPDIPKPVGPDDDEEGYISVVIEVNPWTLREQEGEI